MSNATRPRSPFEPANQSSDHFLDLDASIVATDQLRATRDKIAVTIRHKAMCCIFGPAGLGKTFSVNASLRELAPEATIRLVCRSRPYPTDVREALYRLLHLPGDPPGKPGKIDDILKPELSRSFRVLLCDEAQWMNTSCFEYFRHLWDEPETQIAIVFVGGEQAARVLKSEPALASRIYKWGKFRPLSRAEVLKAIPDMHPLWTLASEEMLAYIDQEAAHGNFRMWASITHQVLDKMTERGIETPTEELADWIISEIKASL